VGVIATISGFLIGWTVRNVPVESLTVGDWVRSVAWVAVAFGAPIAGAAAATTGLNVPRFSSLLGRLVGPRPEPLSIALAALLILLVILAVQAALGLVFNPRYRDFPFTALISATIPFLVLTAGKVRPRQLRPDAESVAAATLALCAIYIVLNETLANWQALCFCAGLLALALSLLSARDAPNSG
jgi:glucan 1,3-beta-glucosidase